MEEGVGEQEFDRDPPPCREREVGTGGLGSYKLTVSMSAATLIAPFFIGCPSVLFLHTVVRCQLGHQSSLSHLLLWSGYIRRLVQKQLVI